MEQRTQTAADRYRTWRSRQQRGAICAQVEIGPEFTSALRQRGLIAPDHTPERSEIAAHASAVLALWAGEQKETTSMLQKLNPLDALADLPACPKLEKARVALDQARQAEQIAADAFRAECRRITARGSILLDAAATKVESETLRAAAAARLAAADVEAAKRAHGETLAKFFRKNEAALDHLVELVRDARDAARTIARAVAAAENDGANSSLKLRKARRVATDLQTMLTRLL